MPTPNLNPDESLLKRRNFFRNAGTLAGAASLSFPNIAESAPNKSPLKLGLIGCGGRGTGAANQALSADKDVTLTTVADVFEGNANGAINNLKNRHPDQVGSE